jgi:hypothetical protein
VNTCPLLHECQSPNKAYPFDSCKAEFVGARSALEHQRGYLRERHDGMQALNIFN